MIQTTLPPYATLTSLDEKGNIEVRELTYADVHIIEKCYADRDGDCSHVNCPQLRDDEPKATGRHCPIDTWKDEDYGT